MLFLIYIQIYNVVYIRTTISIKEYSINYADKIEQIITQVATLENADVTLIVLMQKEKTICILRQKTNMNVKEKL